MRHVHPNSRQTPAMAGLILPGFPASHPVSFLKDNWPQSLGGWVQLVAGHLDVWFGDES